MSVNAANGRIVVNWLGHIPNPFGLRVPPEWFLQELAAFDDQLVLYPSQEAYFYRLTRRRRLSPGLSPALSWGKDSAVCVTEGLIPVTSFGGNITFSAHIFQWLRDRDQWQFRDPGQIADRLDEFDRQHERQTTTDMDAENTARARSMYHTYKTRVGERVSLNDVNRGRQHLGKRSRIKATTGPAPVPPTGWNVSPSGLVTPPQLR